MARRAAGNLPLWVVAAVAMTPILPVLVALTAALAAGITTSIKGQGVSAASRSPATELTVPQAQTIAFTPWPRRKAASSRAYRVMTSSPREP